MQKKMYYFSFLQTVFFGILVFAADITLILLLLANVLPALLVTLSLCLTLWGTWDLFHTDFFTPVYISKTKIKFKGQEYSWDDIRITAYPEGQRSFYYSYVLYFGLQPSYTKDLLKKNKICQVYLNEKISI
ncbi:MAG: hypothetical protein IKC31_02480 [Clostridia bacterium]|nr:hypothetical protein [Clostridia bacterium]